MKKFTSALAVVLSVLMILCSLPMAAFAIDNSPETTDYEWIGNPLSIADATSEDTNGTHWNSKYGIMLATGVSVGIYAQNAMPKVNNVYTDNGEQVVQLYLGRESGVAEAAGDDYGYVIDTYCPTISGVNGIAVWADFSEFEYDDYWRVASVDTSVNLRSEMNNATNNLAGQHNAYDSYRASNWNTSGKSGTATLINTKTGEIITESFTAATTSIKGAFRVPAGFVGYIFFEFDNKEADMSTLGGIVLYRRDDTVNTTSTDTSVANVNQQSLNIRKNYAFGDLYAVADVDAFAADILSGKLGKLNTSGCGMTVEGNTVTVNAIEGAVAYVANVNDSANNYAFVESVESESNVITLSADAGDNLVQVVAYDEEGAVIDIVGAHVLETITVPATTTTEGSVTVKCSICGTVISTEVIPALGVYGPINPMTDYDDVIRGREGAINFDMEGYWTPSLESVSLNSWAYAGMLVKLDLTNAEGFAFFINTKDSPEQSDSAYFDIYGHDTLNSDYGDEVKGNEKAPLGECNNGKPIFGVIGSTTTTVDSRNTTFKLYNMLTGELTDGTVNSTTKELYVPTPFVGYVIVDLSNYTLMDVNTIRELYIEKSYTTVNAHPSNGSTSGNRHDKFDNFMAVYDVDAFAEGIADFVKNNGGSYPAGNGSVWYQCGNGVIVPHINNTEENPFEAAEYRVYEIAEDGDTLKLVKTVPADQEITTEGLEDGTYYVQPYDANGVASKWNAVTVCNHNFDFDNAEFVDPDCENNGSATVVCDKCDKVEYTLTEEEIIEYFGVESLEEAGMAALGHDFSVFVETVEPTDEEQGYDVYECANGCGETEKQNFVDPVPSTFETAYGIVYEYVDGGVAIIDYVGESTEVTIPATIGDAVVKYVDGGAFADNDLTVVNLEGNVACFGDANNPVFAAGDEFIVNIGKDVVSVPAYMFYGAHVKEINFAADGALVFIEDYAFYNARIISLNIPDSVVSIGKQAFRGAVHLKRITLGANVEEIGAWAFAFTSNLESVKLNDTLYKIDNYAFYETGLTEITIPFSVGYIGRLDPFTGADVEVSAYTYSFAAKYYAEDYIDLGIYYETLDASDFTYKVVGDGIKITGFTGEYTKYMEIPAEIDGKPVVEIGWQAFFNGAANKAVYAIKLPDSVTTIGGQAFRALVHLHTVEAANVNNIGARAFMYCGDLENVNVADENLVVGVDAFLGCIVGLDELK